MNWEAFGAIAEMLGSVAVLATLVYLAIQIRQSKEVSRTQAYHLAIEQLVAGSMRPEISLLFESERRELTSEEKLQLASPLIGVIYGHEIVYYLWRKGQVDDDLWQNIWLNNRRFLSLRPAMELLEAREGPLSRALLDLLRETSEEGDPAPG